MNELNAYEAADRVGKLSYFPEAVAAGIAPPGKFTFPFFYEPHPLARIAAAELQAYLEGQASLDHNFGLGAEPAEGAIGKMFGVLVVQDAGGRLAYLSAFSGKLAGTNAHERFVPPVFDMLAENSFFLKGIAVIDAVNRELDALLSDGSYTRLLAGRDRLAAEADAALAAQRHEMKRNKHARDARRERECGPGPESEAALEAELVRESLADKRRLKALTEHWTGMLRDQREALSAYETRIDSLRAERKERSAALQQQLFEQYEFLNLAGKRRSLQDIFSETAFGRPPAAAGECATPKLLQYAFLNGYRPLAMAEFWWGASPRSEIRKHRQFYPACTGKCKPILAHMLEGIEVDENPFLRHPQELRRLETVFEDGHLLVVNKPAGLRSVPGVDIDDSVYSRLKDLLPGTEPLLVHRLDMDTSGLLVVAKTRQAHAHIQKQFLRRTVRKRYTALLAGVVAANEGEIRLPLRADPFNRPRQLVCFEKGKASHTRWQVVARGDDTTKVHFWPLTGRTHQLRMHAAHALGLNAPIVGDDLYGTGAERMFLHAAELEFVHPVTRAAMTFEAPEEF